MFGEHECTLGKQDALEAKDEADDDYILKPAGHHLPIAREGVPCAPSTQDAGGKAEGGSNNLRGFEGGLWVRRGEGKGMTAKKSNHEFY